MTGARISRPVVGREGIVFWLLGNVVVVRYTFFLVSVLLGGLGRRSIPGVLEWVLVVGVSVLLHELGHALVARAFGQDPRIELHASGGTTSWSSERPLSWAQRIAVSLAGPGFGFLAALVLSLVQSVTPPTGVPVLQMAARDFFWVNVAWGVFNLLPILPLDGGGAMDAVLMRALGPDRGRSMARMVSIAVGIGVAVLAAMGGQTWAALLCGIFAWDNLQRLRGLSGVALPR